MDDVKVGELPYNDGQDHVHVTLQCAGYSAESERNTSKGIEIKMGRKRSLVLICIINLDCLLSAFSF